MSPFAEILREDRRICLLRSPVSYTHLDVYKRQAMNGGTIGEIKNRKK